MINIKQLFTLVLFTILLAACGGEATVEVPQDLAGKKAYLQQKKAEMRALETEIASVEAEVEKLEPQREKRRTVVTTAPVKKENFQHFVTMQGAVEADETVNASSEVGGRIVQMNIKEGQNITKGQLVATVDLEQIDKQEAEILTSLDLAKEVYERQKRLWDQNIGSEMQFLQAKNSMERLEKSLETLRFQKTKANVYAPISGVAEMVFLEAGELAAPGAPIIQILNTRKVKVVVDLPETYLTKVKRGDKVVVEFPALNRTQEARISMIGRQIDPANRTFPVEVNLNNGNGLLKPNLLVEMKVNDETLKDAVTVPLELVQQEVSGKSFVYVKDQDKDGAIAKKMYVKTGLSYEGKIVIEEGLTGNEELIVDGARTIAANEPIMVK